MADRLPASLDALGLCLDLDPEFAPAYSMRAAVHLRAARPAEALRDVQRALDLRPDHTGDLHNRAVVWTALGEYERAVRDYEAVLARQPRSAGTRHNLAWVLATASDPRMRDGPRALALAREAVREGDVPAWLDTLAAAYAECGDFANAAAVEAEACRRTRPANERFRSRLEAYRRRRTYTEWRTSYVGRT